MIAPRRVPGWVPRYLHPTLACAALALGAVACLACSEPVDLTLPTVDQASSYYQSTAPIEFEITGNVASLTVTQDDRHLRRGGRLWAKVGPYIYLFTPATQELLRDYPGLAGVRVTTTTQSSTTVASAVLERDALNDLTWRRAISTAGRARVNGTTQVKLLEDLVEFGEPLTEHEYNARFLRR